jgi:RND family efflux transporter MFP subunit
MLLFGFSGVLVQWGGEVPWTAGITEPIRDVTLAFPVVGIVMARPFPEGAVVKQGEALVELDKRIEELEVERRRLVRDLARMELDRLKSLAERNAISVSPEEIDKKQAEYDTGRVEHDLAVETLRRRTLMSPFDGAIAEYYKDVGEKCEDQQSPVVRVVDTRRCYFVANIEAKAGEGLRLDQPVEVELDAGDVPIKVRGTIAYVSPVVEPASGLLRVKVVYDNPDGRVRPGVVGRARFSR